MEIVFWSPSGLLAQDLVEIAMSVNHHVPQRVLCVDKQRDFFPLSFFNASDYTSFPIARARAEISADVPGKSKLSLFIKIDSLVSWSQKKAQLPPPWRL